MSGRYVYQSFPKCKYHPDGRVRVVAHAGEELALGSDWADRPFPPAPDPPAPPSPEPRRRGRPPKERQL